MDTVTGNIKDLLSEEGFLRDPALWSETIAQAIAHRDGLTELTAEHWRIIHALREHYQAFGSAPPAFSHICHANHMDKHCIAQLFRSQREAWRIAGLPDPGEEARTYM